MSAIFIHISPQGEPTIVSTGYSGDRCLDATAPYERALGAKTSDTPTVEMYSEELAREIIAGSE